MRENSVDARLVTGGGGSGLRSGLGLDDLLSSSDRGGGATALDACARGRPAASREISRWRRDAGMVVASR